MTDWSRQPVLLSTAKRGKLAKSVMQVDSKTIPKVCIGS